MQSLWEAEAQAWFWTVPSEAQEEEVRFEGHQEAAGQGTANCTVDSGHSAFLFVVSEVL